jgi:hypothetical protein
MKSLRSFALSLATATLFASAASAAGPAVDLDSPLTSIGREDNVRVEAQLLNDTVASGSAIGVTFQVENMSDGPIAIAEKVCSASFDADTQTVTLSIGSEVPEDGVMPKVTALAAGEKKTFTTGAVVRIITANLRSAFAAVPRFVQVKVSVLRNVTPFAALIQRQSQGPASVRVPLDDHQFETWLESNDTIFLNPVPVRFTGTRRIGADAAERGGFGSL